MHFLFLWVKNNHQNLLIMNISHIGQYSLNINIYDSLFVMSDISYVINFFSFWSQTETPFFILTVLHTLHFFP